MNMPFNFMGDSSSLLLFFGESKELFDFRGDIIIYSFFDFFLSFYHYHSKSFFSNNTYKDSPSI